MILHYNSGLRRFRKSDDNKIETFQYQSFTRHYFPANDRNLSRKVFAEASKHISQTYLTIL